MANKRITDLNPKDNLGSTDLIQVLDMINLKDYNLAGSVLLDPTKISFDPQAGLESTTLSKALIELSEKATIGSPDYYVYVDGNFEITVGPDGDFTKLSEAIRSVARLRKSDHLEGAPVYNGTGTPFILITLKDGYVWDETFEFRGGESFAHITVKQEALVIYTSESFAYSNRSAGIFGVTDGSVGPNFELNIDLRNTFSVTPFAIVNGAGSKLLSHGKGLQITTNASTALEVSSGGSFEYIPPDSSDLGTLTALRIYNMTGVGLFINGGTVQCHSQTENLGASVQILGGARSLLIDNGGQLLCDSLGATDLGYTDGITSGTLIQLDNHSRISAGTTHLNSVDRTVLMTLDNNSEFVTDYVRLSGYPMGYIFADNKSGITINSGNILSNLNLDYLIKLDHNSFFDSSDTGASTLLFESTGSAPALGFFLIDNASNVYVDNVTGVVGENKPFFSISNGSIVNKVNSIGDANQDVNVWTLNGVINEALNE